MAIELRLLGRADLRDGTGKTLHTVVAQPKRFGLLVFLALSRPAGFHRRDELLALLWPDQSEDRARNALNQALSFLRRSLGADTLPSRGSDEVGVDLGSVSCDARAFLDAADRGDEEGALALFTGDLLPAFHVDDAAAFGEWLDGERRAIRERAVTCTKRLSVRAEQRGDVARAVEWTLRGTALEPFDEELVRQLVLLHHRSDNPGRAIQAYDEYVGRIRRELDIEPSPELEALISEIRTRPAPAPPKRAASEASAPVQSSTSSAGPATIVATPSASQASPAVTVAAGRRNWRPVVALATATAVVAGVGMVRRHPHDGGSELVVVADFATAPTDSGIADMLTEETRRALSGSRSINPAPDSRISDTRRRLHVAGEQRMTVPVARQVALGDGIRAVVTGQLRSFAGSYAIELRLISASSEEVLASAGRIGVTPDRLTAVLDTLTRTLRERAGDDRAAINAQPALMALTSTSLEAMSDFVAARRVPNDSAVKLLRHAVTLDTSFAVAYWQLAFRSGRATRAERHALLARAYAHREGLTEYERLRVEAAYLYSPSGETPDRGKLVKLLRRTVEKYPNASDIAILGAFYWDRRELAAAESTFRRALTLDSTQAEARVRLVDVLLARNQVAEARKAVDALLRTSPELELHETTVLYAEGRRDRMREIFTSRVGSNGLGPEDYYLNNAWLDLLEGRLADWDRDAGSSIAADSTTARLGVLAANYWARRRRAESVQLLDSLFAEDSTQRRSLTAAILYAQLGRPGQARAILAAHDAATDAGRHSFVDVGRRSALGWILLDEGRPLQAIAEFRGDRMTTDGFTNDSPIAGDVEIGLAFTRAGQPDSAIASYEHYLNTPYGDRFTDDALQLSWVLEHLAALYEGKQERREARAAYARLVDLWKDADPELQPRVMHARRRLAALSS